MPTPPASPPTSPPTSGRLTGGWLDGIAALHKAMDAIVPSVLTPETMHTVADRLSGCSRTLDGLGAGSDRLHPVADLAAQACAKYEECGECFATAADVGPVVGSPEEQRYTTASVCGFTALSAGSKLFADAEMKGFEIKESAAR
jgi:hypothetical protein